MPQKALVFRVLVASPGDCVQERKAIPEVIRAWNAAHALQRGVFLEPVLWETHSRPELGDRPQGILNKQLVEQCDLVIAAFWTRLGTQTGEAESGTAEEILEFRRRGKPVLLYFSSVPVVLDSVDLSQYSALNEYRKKLESEGLISRYENIADLREQLYRHLSSLDELVGSDADREESLPSQPEAAFSAFREEFESFRRRLAAEWDAEKSSDPVNTDAGKYILERAADDVLDFLGRIQSTKNSRVPHLFQEAVRKAKALQRHQTYMDGGASFRQFWTDGDEALRMLEGVSQELAIARSPSPTESEALSDQETRILQLLAEDGVRPLTAEQIASRISETTQKTMFFLERMKDESLILDRLAMGSPTRFQLARGGRAHLVERGLL